MGTQEQTELDTRDDTLGGGANLWLHELTEKVAVCLHLVPVTTGCMMYIFPID